MSKGPPGAYPPLFLLLLVAIGRQWDALWQFVRCGALVTLLVLAAPWFIYILHTVGIEQWKHELEELSGEDHPGHFWQYFYELFVAAAPWSLLLPAALVPAIQRWRESRLTGMLLWVGVIFLPLCFIGNKQMHYLLPLMPALMILIGWWIDLALGPLKEPARRVPLIEITIAGSILAVIAIPVAARLKLGHIREEDWRLAALVATGLVAVATIWIARGLLPALIAYFAATLVVLVPVVGMWMPDLDQDDSRRLAGEIAARFGPGPYCFYGPNTSLALCFSLRRAIPQAKTPAELQQFVRSQAGLVVIVQNKSKYPALPPPSGFALKNQFRAPGQRFDIYKADSRSGEDSTFNLSSHFLLHPRARLLGP